MMKNITFIFLVLVSIGVCSQTKRFYYNTTMKIDSVNIVKDVTVLEINDKNNLFFSEEYLRIDSLNNASNTFQFAYPKFKRVTIWNNNDNSFDIQNKISMNYYQYNKKISIKWELMEEKKKIGTYTVQKALGKYGGRNWIAWFTNEIPLPFGPYVFKDLPGLILEIYDDTDSYHFSFVENINFETTLPTDQMLEKYLGRHKFVIKDTEWKQIQLNYYNNPIPEYKEGNAMMVRENGTQYTARDYREMEQNIQQSIRRYNNPIELSEKINFK